MQHFQYSQIYAVKFTLVQKIVCFDHMTYFLKVVHEELPTD